MYFIPNTISILTSFKKPCLEHLIQNTYLRHLFSFKHHKDAPFPVFDVVTNTGTQRSTWVWSPSSELWSRPPCWHRSLSLVVYSCWPVLHVLCWIVSFNGRDVRWCCDELPIFHLAAFRKIYYLCTFVHLHRVTERIRINLYRNSTVKLIITCYTQVSTFNDWPIDLNHSYI